MAMFRFLTVGLIMCSLISCVAPSNTYKSYPASPIEPDWQPFTRAPIVATSNTDTQKNFIVSDEFIVKAGQQQDYIKRFKQWKQENVIP